MSMEIALEAAFKLVEIRAKIANLLESKAAPKVLAPLFREAAELEVTAYTHAHSQARKNNDSQNHESIDSPKLH